jgi:hypothetical protein
MSIEFEARSASPADANATSWSFKPGWNIPKLASAKVVAGCGDVSATPERLSFEMISNLGVSDSAHVRQRAA